MIDDDDRRVEPQLHHVQRVEHVDHADLRHLLGILRRWSPLILGGAVFIMGATFAILRLTPPDFRAETVVQIDQPALVATGSEGRGTAEKILRLMPTFARQATSDGVLEAVRSETAADASVATLRQHVRAQPVPNELALRITAQGETEQVADRLSMATAATFAAFLEESQADGGVPEAFRYVVTPLATTDAERPSRNEARTLVLAGLLGLAVMSALAMLLDYIARPDDDAADLRR